MAENSTNAAFESALRSERKDRAVAMLGLPELIAGVQVEPLTPRRLEWLRAMGNPFVCGGHCPIAAIPDFLWYITKDFEFGNEEKRNAFLKAIIGVNEDELREGIDEYLDRAFLDAPTGAAGTPFYSPTAGLYHALNASFPQAGWTVQAVLDTPLRVIYQLIKAADRDRGCVVSNRRSSPLITKYLDEIEHFDVATVDEIDAFIESKRAEGYGLCSEPTQKLTGGWIVAMRRK